MKTDPRFFEYYESLFDERERLARREGQLELVRTKELIGRFLPTSNCRVIDVGGGTGVYASWLASLGHRVHLVDLVPAHVDEALAIGTFSAAVGDARALSDADETYDVALVLGPLYHLLTREDRLLALREARRVVSVGGLVVASFISRGAVALDGYVKGWIDNPGAVHTLTATVRDGSFVNDRPGFGVISYFHLPSEVRREFTESGLAALGVFGVEGPGWIAADFDDRWARAEGREAVLESARACEEDAELQVLSAHLLGFARRS